MNSQGDIKVWLLFVNFILLVVYFLLGDTARTGHLYFDLKYAAQHILGEIYIFT